VLSKGKMRSGISSERVLTILSSFSTILPLSPFFFKDSRRKIKDKYSQIIVTKFYISDTVAAGTKSTEL